MTLFDGKIQILQTKGKCPVTVQRDVPGDIKVTLYSKQEQHQ